MTLLYQNPELCSSSFTFGRAQASLAILSLNHDLATIPDVEAICGLVYALTVQVVVGIRFANGVDWLTDVCRTITIAASAAK